MKRVLTVAGSDCSGGAGIQADLKTFSAHGVFGMSVITSVVAENTSRVISFQDVTPDMISDQIDAVFEDIEVDAVKVGMLSCAATMRAVARKLEEYQPKWVVTDPVMYAKNGAPLMDPASTDTLVSDVLPRSDVVTPNIPEAERIAGIGIKTLDDMKRAAESIREMGPRYVIVKGGHSSGDAVDVLLGDAGFQFFSSERIDTKNTHGTGCTYSSAIASNLALGLTVERAVSRAKSYVTGAIRRAITIGRGYGPTNHFFDMYVNGLREETTDYE
ncbi:MAG: bifunctional hydroxymethylpyrimidine kinase/phosphomethylpyrimidine kinase [Synergistaceae bacterium]|jgi:hydroxymethylpyrimidine/phosphomethylpyrimidine kinase|nr:bifunctional hydroxymethylpyrimidine kinase/phosphomethylpyrimidine kinase [Synergistaceae bacterium]